jgi:bacterial/archaeal transporter family-2 protein
MIRMDRITLVYLFCAALTGCCIALQATVNGRFRQNLDNPTYAVFFSICGTIICAVVAVLVIRPPVPTMEQFRTTSWWNWIGGPLGALIVLAGATLTSELKPAVFISFVVAGQLILSLLIEHFGWLETPVKIITPGRFIGVLMILGGAVCVKYL